MKKTITAILLFLSLNVAAQKKDTTIQITVTLEQYKALLYAIDVNIDSKKITKEILEFIQKSSQIVADKPKEKK